MTTLSAIAYAVAAERTRDRDPREVVAERRERREIDRAREAIAEARAEHWGRS